ncbi:Eukaryotic translation initiation factor 3 subunit J [Rhynchospora pubera]|uniref:Eukaryotic translation initiation factor 3 subunit J n=1 Tax=Rhynchospora pubera TaxID=906938 RepID=A0AAV8F4N9_9POAL|nr:Eukaryotic translation initiation factor 3 subunit J [Rhynchospora pubera]
MADWEEDDFEPVPPGLKPEPVKSKWEDEEEDDDDVKESWEDEDEPVKETKPEPVVEKSAPKPSTKGTTKKGKQPELAAKNVEVSNEVLSDPVAEKLRQQRLVEEADFKSAADLFGKKGNDEKTIDNFIPKSESDFLEYAELLSHKIRPFEKSYHYNGLLKAVNRLAMTNMKAADAKEISSSVNAIANEKIKLEKEAQAGKKKTGAKKKQLHIEKADDDFAMSGTYDNADDYDFM